MGHLAHRQRQRRAYVQPLRGAGRLADPAIAVVSCRARLDGQADRPGPRHAVARPARRAPERLRESVAGTAARPADGAADGAVGRPHDDRGSAQCGHGDRRGAAVGPAAVPRPARLPAATLSGVPDGRPRKERGYPGLRRPGLAGAGVRPLPARGALQSEFAYDIAANKTAFFIADSLARLRPSHVVTGRSPGAVAQFRYLDPQYPFLRGEDTPDVLGGYFNFEP